MNNILRDHCLSVNQLANLNNTVNAYLSGMDDENIGCVQKGIYLRMKSLNRKIGFCIDSTMTVGQGAYNPNSGTMIWKYGEGITVQTQFAHEFFHAYQDAYYINGTAQYNSGTRTGFPNIEFEQAILNDIIYGSSEASAMGSSADAGLRAEYRTWINSITNNNTTYPKQFSDFGGQYYYFLNKFYENSSYANIGVIKNDLPPNALLSIFSNSNCK